MDRTLVVDDSPTMRRMVIASLRGVCTGGFSEAASGLEAIAVTAYGSPQDERQAAAAGFRMHLTKPIAPDALAAAVVQVLPPGRARQR